MFARGIYARFTAMMAESNRPSARNRGALILPGGGIYDPNAPLAVKAAVEPTAKAAEPAPVSTEKPAAKETKPPVDCSKLAALIASVRPGNRVLQRGIGERGERSLHRAAFGLC